MNVGIVGLGAMGGGMAANLHRAGVLACVYNRSRQRSDEFIKTCSVDVAGSVADLAAGCDVIIICVSHDEDVLAVVAQIEPVILPGTVVVDTSTVSHTTAKHVEKQLANRDAYFLDAPVSGGAEGAKNGTLAMMVGGDSVVLERVRPVLEAMTKTIVHMGGVGTGQATKAVNQIMGAGINQAVTEALAFAEAEGLPIDKVIEVVGAGASGNWFLDHRGATMTQDEFAPGFKLGLHYKDLEICKAMVAEHGVQLPVVEMTLILKGTSIHCLWPLPDLKRADARRNPPIRLVALSRIVTQQTRASDQALRGLQTSSGSALSLLNRPQACLRNDALILNSSVSQRP